MIDEPDEILDLTDDQDQVIGTVSRQEFHELTAPWPGHIRASEAFLQNDQGKLWIPRRQHTKQIAPGGLDFSMAEHVGSGEDYLTAAVRGFSEELNLEIKASDLSEIGILSPSEDHPYFCHVYLYRTNQVPNYSKKDYVSFEWLTPEELARRLKAGEPAKNTLLPALQQFFKI